jgi:glycosyltransferase involved in cell wall biosynthesis
MNLLWMTNTPAAAAEEFGYVQQGGGWITSLLEAMLEESSHKVGICFFYEGGHFKKLIKNNVFYYGMPVKNKNRISRIFDRHRFMIDDENDTYLDQVLADFQPDIIQVFGTESGLGKILLNKFNKVVFHLQGLAGPYAEVYLPPHVGTVEALWYEKTSNTLRGLSFYHQYRWLENRGLREKQLIRNWKYFIGRTEWDRNYTRLINPGAHYFHCDELLRKSFYEYRSTTPIRNNKTKFIIASTINPNLHKGLDLIYKTLILLNNLEIEWRIFGIEENNQLNRFITRTLKIKKKPDQLVFMGPTSEKELANRLAECHLFVHPSYIDNSPNSVCEAMLLGLPVLSSGVGGVPSLITHNKTGYLFNPYDRYDLAGWISQIHSNYDHAIACGTAAKETAVKRHNKHTILKELLTIYEIILKDK